MLLKHAAERQKKKECCACIFCKMRKQKEIRSHEELQSRIFKLDLGMNLRVMFCQSLGCYILRVMFCQSLSCYIKMDR